MEFRQNLTKHLTNLQCIFQRKVLAGYAVLLDILLM